jgi:hypothetical protein
MADKHEVLCVKKSDRYNPQILLANSKLVGRCPQFWLRLQPFSHQNRRSFEKTDDLPHERHFANSITPMSGSPILGDETVTVHVGNSANKARLPVSKAANGLSMSDEVVVPLM